jgi:hypothetical protein
MARRVFVRDTNMNQGRMETLHARVIASGRSQINLTFMGSRRGEFLHLFTTVVAPAACPLSVRMVSHLLSNAPAPMLTRQHIFLVSVFCM